ncbi:hypothetical protein GJAV_G00260920 [Gymnothorax javanicus]|nr:hypothetical protein GJAV_G00260920 [Gymnothorax javanicus]
MKSVPLAVYMYLAVCNGGFPYNDYLDEVKKHLLADYLFKVPLLDSTCNEQRDNYLQVKWTLECFIQRNKDYNTKNSNVSFYIRLLSQKLTYCQNLSRNRCNLGKHPLYINMTQFQVRYNEAYEYQDETDFIPCHCPGTSTAVSRTEIFGNLPELPGTPNNLLQSTAATEIPTASSGDTTKAQAVMTNTTSLDSELLLTTSFPFVFMGLEMSEKTVFSSIVCMAIAIACLSCATLYLWFKNRQLRRALLQSDIALEERKDDEFQTEVL